MDGWVRACTKFCQNLVTVYIHECMDCVSWMFVYLYVVSLLHCLTTSLPYRLNSSEAHCPAAALLSCFSSWLSHCLTVCELKLCELFRYFIDSLP